VTSFFAFLLTIVAVELKKENPAGREGGGRQGKFFGVLCLVRFAWLALKSAAFACFYHLIGKSCAKCDGDFLWRSFRNHFMPLKRMPCGFAGSVVL
jgi:hypothetical protein